MQDLTWMWERPPADAVVIAAHPDDEVIGAGALLARLRRPLVVHLTDGAPRDGRDARAAGFACWADYASVRRREAEAALAVAGIPAGSVLGLGLADQQAGLSLAAAARSIAALLRDRAAAVVITHAYEGGHPDHDAAAFAVHAARFLLARGGRRPPEIVEMTGYHAAGGDFVAGDFLPAADAGPVVGFDLDAAARSLKRGMIDCHATQRAVLAPFPVEVERFRRAPRYDFGVPPHPGQLHYERYDWGMTGERWRRLARATLAVLGLVAA